MSIPNEQIPAARKRNRAGFSMAWLVAVTALLCHDAGAHSTVKSTTPTSGSILASSPEEISIEFNETARLIAVFATSANGSERKLRFEPAGTATSFTVPAPGLAPGRNEVRWTALSKDGHPIKGTIIIVVKPGAAPQSSAPVPSQDRGS